MGFGKGYSGARGFFGEGSTVKRLSVQFRFLVLDFEL